MEYIPGGELYSHLRMQKTFNIETSRFYAAEVASAFMYMHLQGAIYRDLKPENLLINRDGHLKLVDFGFVKVLKSGEKTYTLCGTPEYLAPELVMQTGHSFPVDWWTLGIFLYEMVLGRPPFVDDNPHNIYKKVLEEDPEIPEDTEEEVFSLIEGLLKKNQALRSGANDVKESGFFRAVSWREVEGLRLKPPIVPKLKGKDDCSYFDTYKEESDSGEKARLPKFDMFSEF